MTSRYLFAWLGLFFFVGGGGLWLWAQFTKRKKLTRNLLSQPKERRFFWYLLRKQGFRVLRFDVEFESPLSIDGSRRDFSLRADFIAVRGGKRFVCVHARPMEDRELIPLFAVYKEVFHVSGVVFYFCESRRMTVWE